MLLLMYALLALLSLLTFQYFVGYAVTNIEYQNNEMEQEIGKFERK